VWFSVASSRGFLSAWRSGTVCFPAPTFLFSRRLPLAHYSGVRENSRRDVITKHSVFICFAAAFGYFLTESPKARTDWTSHNPLLERSREWKQLDCAERLKTPVRELRPHKLKENG
jgi:hypothetical protein